MSSASLEADCALRHDMHFYENAAVSATYHMEHPFSEVTQLLIRKACQDLVEQHPILSTFPWKDDEGKLVYRRSSEIDLTKMIFVHERKNKKSDIKAEDSELETLLQVQHNLSFSPPLPFWRLCILHDPLDNTEFTACFVFHHSIADGTSGMIFHASFLRALGNCKSKDDLGNGLFEPKEQPLLPSLEDLAPKGSYGVNMTSEIVESESVSESSVWKGASIMPPSDTQIRLMTIDNMASSSLAMRCRAESTTVTAALQTIIACAFFDHIPRGFTTVRSSVPYSARRLLPPNIPQDSIGVWIGEIKDEYHREATTAHSEFPWDEARRSRQIIEATLSRVFNDHVSSMKEFDYDKNEKSLLSKIGQSRGSTFELSNIGRLPTKDLENGGSKFPFIGRMFLSQACSVSGSAVEISVVTGGDGCLTLTFAWQTGVVSADLMDSVRASVLNKIHEITQE
ncbi:unnamed protein product [Penicillium olsonii]|uniref:Alcohol acetyltransferase n=1 Tax=Penicillium olsonii TaxID=99116 RepID=A0A9W4HAN8_PENOL|nr:unnamed protein product [Penicillium olsonii]